MAQAFDKNGGGHHNACGCRVMPLDDGQRSNRLVTTDDIDKNIEEWLKIWSKRN